MIGIFKRLIEKNRREAAERESRKMRVQLVDMICSMNEEQFTWFIEKAREQIPELRETCDRISEIKAEVCTVPKETNTALKEG